MEAFATVLSSVSGNPNNSAAANNSRNVATTTSQFSETRQVQEAIIRKHCTPSELSCLSLEVQPWSLKKEAKEQRLQIYEHSHQ
jgi:hypothetical protein